jgi:hypothetical protein
MPTIPLTKSELADLAAYILSLQDRDGEGQSASAIVYSHLLNGGIDIERGGPTGR